MVTNAKLHHFVPQLELSYFAQEEMIWVYDRKINTFREQKIRNTMAITNYYSFYDSTGKINKDLEEALSIGEGIAAPIIKRLVAGDWKLTIQERLEFSAYLALKWTRTPTHQKKSEAIFEAIVKLENKKLASNEKKFKEVMKRISTETGEKIDIEEQRKFLLDEKILY